MSRHSFSIHVGSGSSVQDFVHELMMDFVHELMMISFVVSGVIIEKFVNMLQTAVKVKLPPGRLAGHQSWY